MATTAVDLPENPDDVQEDARESRKMDPEILLLSRIARMLDELDAEAKARVIAYLSSRYDPSYHPGEL